MNSLHWADQKAEEIIKVRGEKKEYVCESGVSPSGVVHFGNLRDPMTVDIVVKALEDYGKKVRFLYVWDDFDRFRKVPSDIPKEYSRYVGTWVDNIPDPYKCHSSYARHFEKEFEENIKSIGLKPQYLYQAELYNKRAYVDMIKIAMAGASDIKDILDRWRSESLTEKWYPVEVYCSKCGKDFTKILDYDGEYSLKYSCECGYDEEIDFSKEGFVKLRWRIDWPMRWHFYNVDFEPAGKEHSSAGSSKDVGILIQKQVFKSEPPVYQSYNIIRLKGEGKKMSKSSGGNITPAYVLKYYLPELVRFFFAKHRPDAEIHVPLDADLIKFYSDFYQYERVFFGAEIVKDEKKLSQFRRVYELSNLKIPGKLPVQLSLKNLAMLVQAVRSNDDVVKMLKQMDNIPSKLSRYDSGRLTYLISSTRCWLRDYAPQELVFDIKKTKVKGIGSNMKPVLESFAKSLLSVKNEDDVKNLCYSVAKESNINLEDFFKAVYLSLLGKEKGPRLAPLIISYGPKRISKIILDNL